MTAAPASAAPRTRSPAQIEAARRNGARSRGPVSSEGKARASRNALKHGLTAIRHLVLDDEDAAELEALTARLMEEIDPTSEVEVLLVQRLAAAFWKGERAERMEVALFDAAPRLRPPEVGGRWVEADPLATFDLARFNAIRAYQAQQGREVSRCLRELRLLRCEPLGAEVDEHEGMTACAEPEAQNEPGKPVATEMRNEPKAPAVTLPLAPAALAVPPPAEVENEPGTLADAGLFLLRPRHPVPWPGPLPPATHGPDARGASVTR
jgi:hypothetical protein